jgi:hypothetical protein
VNTKIILTFAFAVLISNTAVIIMIDTSNFAFAESIDSFQAKCIREHIKTHPVLVCTPTNSKENSLECRERTLE